ncbi:hypothetical protein DB346_17645 [Verrucomicrobia bacterium LW23]|nr:hypothetical protein DB346_17645 [Verrucomicrobia bacterium LW23]
MFHKNAILLAKISTFLRVKTFTTRFSATQHDTNASLHISPWRQPFSSLTPVAGKTPLLYPSQGEGSFNAKDGKIAKIEERNNENVDSL